MKSLVEFILENSEYIYTVYDSNDKTIVNVFDFEEDAKQAAEEYEKQGEEFKTEIKKEKRDTIEKGNQF